LLPTPSFISRFVQTPRVFQREHGTAIRPPSVQASGSTTGAATGSVLPDSWRTRGTGRRLGGD
jgi:Derlin-2/3